MVKAYKSAIAWGLIAAVCICLLSINAFAASAVDLNALKSYRPGPGDHLDEAGNTVSLSGEILVDANGNAENAAAVVQEAPAALKTETVPNYTASTSGDETIYTFEGKKYKRGASYGVHKLSGYSAQETGSSMTASGKNAASRHTVACASNLPLGTVLIIKGSSGPYSSDYDGMYVVEDRGGTHIEDDGWLDIYFDTLAEAARTTDAGWNYAEAWIAVPME